VALGINGGVVVQRVRALRQPVPAPRRRRLLGPALATAGILAASAMATAEFVVLARAWL
jgi:hypothetical protein